MITIHQRYRQTDRQTTCDHNTALCTKVHRAVKNERAKKLALRRKHQFIRPQAVLNAVNWLIRNNQLYCGQDVDAEWHKLCFDGRPPVVPPTGPLGPHLRHVSVESTDRSMVELLPAWPQSVVDELVCVVLR